MGSTKLQFAMPLLLLAGAAGLVAQQPPAPQSARTDIYGDPLPQGAVARLGTIRFRHGKGIAALALSPDGKSITSAGGDGSIVVHDAATGAKLRSISGETTYVSAALTPDGRTLATVVEGRRVSVRKTATGKRIAAFEVEKAVHTLAISSDGRTLVGSGGH